ncbi:MAG: DUF4956 domain-containing protein [Bdellovibrionales bacterium]|jgi:uncharacterized membrane protein YhiD involved in acid resistance|nr:DUF4956 domain-containing protein [Bdellovibrionales bacterium]MBT3527276.1 DUF4956 domain-containing protein [Bdellovibrionales bacterium]MBT7669888.1 DUF4956 domain-containing protein [Bdellovibrionales bacterium]MBT7765945.1 DUF4956 domain-containing protein [Bdellovibrionales bacterium]
MLDMLNLQATAINPTLVSVIYSLCLAFVLSVMVSITYQRTFLGLSYSKNFIHSLILGSIVTTIAMMAIGDNLARGMGMMGALAIIRFRSTLKDTKDMIYMFIALAIGICCGVYSFSIALVGTSIFCLVAFLLNTLPFTKTTHFDGLLKFNLENVATDKQGLESILNRHCLHFALVTLRELSGGKRLDYAYQVKLKKGEDYSDFITDLTKLDTIQGVNLLVQQSTVEV